MSDHVPDGGGGGGRDEPRRQVWKVSELTRRIKGTLEGAFGSVWVEGEISNFRKPGICAITSSTSLGDRKSVV